MLRPVFLQARDLPDAWFQLLYHALEPGVARKRPVDQGSFAGETRLEFDYVTCHILFPASRPLIPDIPPQYGIPNPTDMSYVEAYFERYLMSGRMFPGEQYTYGSRLTEYLCADGTVLNQVDEVIRRYMEHGPGTNQLVLQIAQPSDLLLDDPPCFRQIFTRIEEGRLHFHVAARSNDLWSGFPANMAGLQLMKEFMAAAMGLADGEIVYACSGLHLYSFTWEVAGIRRGLSLEEVAKLLALPTSSSSLSATDPARV